MNMRLYPLLRRALPLLSGGVLLQTGGCGVDLGAFAVQVTQSILGQLVGGLVFGAFNLV